MAAAWRHSGCTCGCARVRTAVCLCVCMCVCVNSCLLCGSLTAPGATNPFPPESVGHLEFFKKLFILEYFKHEQKRRELYGNSHLPLCSFNNSRYVANLVSHTPSFFFGWKILKRILHCVILPINKIFLRNKYIKKTPILLSYLIEINSNLLVSSNTQLNIQASLIVPPIFLKPVDLFKSGSQPAFCI